MTLQEYAKQLKGLLENQEHVEKTLSDLKETIDMLQSEFVKFMEDNQIAVTPEIEGIGVCKLDIKTIGRVNEADQPIFFSWLKEQGEGGMIKTKESVHRKTLEGWVNKRLDANLPLPEQVKLFTVKKVVIKEGK